MNVISIKTGKIIHANISRKIRPSRIGAVIRYKGKDYPLMTSILGKTQPMAFILV